MSIFCDRKYLTRFTMILIVKYLNARLVPLQVYTTDKTRNNLNKKEIFTRSRTVFLLAALYNHFFMVFAYTFKSNSILFAFGILLSFIFVLSLCVRTLIIFMFG